MLEGIIPLLGVSLAAGIGRGARGYFKHQKEDKQKFNVKKFFVSVGAVAAFSVLIDLLTSNAGLNSGDTAFLVGEVAASWGITDIAEDLKKK